MLSVNAVDSHLLKSFIALLLNIEALNKQNPNVQVQILFTHNHSYSCHEEFTICYKFISILSDLGIGFAYPTENKGMKINGMIDRITLCSTTSFYKVQIYRTSKDILYKLPHSRVGS